MVNGQLMEWKHTSRQVNFACSPDFKWIECKEDSEGEVFCCILLNEKTNRKYIFFSNAYNYSNTVECDFRCIEEAKKLNASIIIWTPPDSHYKIEVDKLLEIGMKITNSVYGKEVIKFKLKDFTKWRGYFSMLEEDEVF